MYMRDTNKGFALIAALLATMIIMAFGVLALLMTGQDIQMSANLVSEKRAESAAETGIHQIMSTFDPNARVAVTNAQADPNNPNLVYSSSVPTQSTTTPEVPAPGFDAMNYVRSNFSTNITGQDTATGTRMDVTVGIGFGPVDAGTGYR